MAVKDREGELALDYSPTVRDRQAWADRLYEHGIRPPYRYEVTTADLVPPRKLNSRARAFALRMIRKRGM